MVDDEEAHGSVGGFEFQAELGLEGFADVVGDGIIPARGSCTQVRVKS
jgi:hypothetical protein